jgi:co-chaperonin GroES (HSP10)
MKKLPLIPRNSLVLVEMDAVREATEGGILLPGGKAPRFGTVRDVGPGALMAGGGRHEMDLKPGDRVYLADERYRCEVEDDDSTWALVPENMIPARVPVAKLELVEVADD